MASVGDYIFLFIVLSIIGGIVYAVKQPAVQQGLSGASENLKKKGISMDESGIKIKTDRRAPTREEYIDSTRDSFARSSEVIAKHKSAFGHKSAIETDVPAMQKQQQQIQDEKIRTRKQA